MADEWDDDIDAGQNFVAKNYALPKVDGEDNDWNDDNPGISNLDEAQEKSNFGHGSRRGRGGKSFDRGYRGGRQNGYGERNGFNHRKGDGDRSDGEWGSSEGADNRNGRNYSRGRNRDQGEDGDGRRDRDRGGAGRGRLQDRDRNNGGGFNEERNNYRDKNSDNAEKKKDLYIPPEPTEDESEIFGQGISSGINFSKYDSIPVEVSGDSPPKAINTFEEADLKPLIMENIRKSGYTRPTPIQKNGIPIIKARRDLMACAQTGSGKTAAFLLPIIHDLLANNEDLDIGKPHALIVSPTRELTIQIFEEARKFARGSYLKISIVYGGTGVKHQGDNIAKGCHILVATPGRLLDFCDRGFITFEDCRYIVLDEADRMLDMGFLPSVEKIMENPTIRPQSERHTLMFSATFPTEIQHLAGRFLNNYIFLTIGIVGGACADVEQNFYEVTRFSKRAKLTDILDQNENNARGTMVFVETQRNADFLASLLSETKYPTTSIHGARLQREREMALRDFKSGKMSVLIATSVAARGLDIKNVDHVINYDLPKSIDEYVHRIGRTGRVGNKGKATSFFDADHDAALAPDLVKILEQANQEVPDFLKSVGGGGGSYRSNNFGGKDVRTMDTRTGIKAAVPAPQEPEEDW
ncbi:ATP-dependent RNA helicase vasa isoform X2 [Condylostylus longicornis]|nr:ATP-dependent RNA helicase vasa isoform X2 [Condylostylus longicornis]XP_055386747.1 ATP-dependent RNA helicase vasa isoform X2 [Condylostylus longicornis]XP_055386750.1 ATP-dependent RNA helicase vasa isoform X2 [Condylostylus longicornis]XP_055386759.1 ATP-dependent RNA helicase vasa isoform X2 [Condylostylus longicornis]